jgi:electron transport complex protein RnfG
MKNMLKFGIILAIYATVACVGLAFVYAGTKKVIAERQKTDLEAALNDLFPQGKGFDEVTGSLKSTEPSVTFNNVYEVKDGNGPLGVAIRAVGASYGGPVTVLVGVGANGKIAGVKVLESKDTPGLGANAANPTYFVDRTKRLTFTDQFKGKAVTDPFEVKGDVIAITASTITSKAITGIVKVCGQTGSQWLATQTGGTK